MSMVEVRIWTVDVLKYACGQMGPKVMVIPCSNGEKT